MKYTIQKLKSSLNNFDGSQSVNKVANFLELLSSEIITVQSNVDLPSSKRKSLIINNIYDNFYFYKLPDDMDIDKIISIEKVVTNINNFDPRYSFVSSNALRLDEKYYSTEGQKFAITTRNDGNQYLQIKETDAKNSVLSDCEDSTLWLEDGATNISDNIFNRISGNQSVSFDIQPNQATNGIFTIDDTGVVDISNDNFITFSLYVPDVSELKSIELRFGLDDTNYFSQEIGLDIYGEAIKDGWNYFYFELSKIKKTIGQPDLFYVPYKMINLIPKTSFTKAVTGVLLDSIISGYSNLYTIEYYSSKIILDGETGLAKNTIDSESDVLNLHDGEYNLLRLKIKSSMVESTSIAPRGIRNKTGIEIDPMQSEYMKFMAKYPSERMLKVIKYGTYYNRGIF
jgi:hypothetical protein